jgi:tRNA pseudouridine55 synthase
MNGLINVLKPPGLTSHDVVVVLRRMFGKKRIGHTGTLDPGAAGVLPICVGQGTRVVEYIINKPKKYRAEFTFGIRTDTYDAGGKIVDRTPYARLEPSVVKDVLQSFKGEINQIPPMVSAVRYHGKRLYQLAREGKEIERKARCVQIYDIKLLRFQNDLEYPRLLCDLECSKGTYVRSICAQVGDKLGCGAYLSFLVRTASGPFLLNNAFTLEEIQAMWERDDLSFLLPIDSALDDIPSFTVKEKAVPHILNGQTLALSGIFGGIGNNTMPDLVCLYSPDGRLLSISKYSCTAEGEWCYKPKKVFCQL